MRFKKYFSYLLLAFLPCTAIAQEVVTTEKQESNPTEQLDAGRASYAIGVSMGYMILQNLAQLPGGQNIDQKEVLRGVSDLLEQKATLSPEEAGIAIRDYFDGIQKKENEANRVAGETFLAENAKKKGVQTTNSGLQYKIIKKGKGIKPTVEDTVMVHYRGKLLDGTVFDSSYERGEPIKFNPLQVIPGWTEGLCLLPKGTKAELYIPHNLAYGERGAGRNIPPFSALIFEIEMIDVIKGKPLPIATDAPISESKEKASTADKNAKK
ncbi:FKBP-type peptidyl-prolyl cis-trans isomerase [Porphyromonas gingivicanis]|uniref:FKBP-type peptidyl-prolyl cis-trans isomerase n=1 Tax=Porphyromonas gingivicanis TaxID=266762 RepID=UPI000471B9EF